MDDDRYGRTPPSSWKWEGALCVGEDPNLWYSEQHRGRSRQAKAICVQCPVQTKCLEYAVERNIGHGIWGGLDGDDRRRIRRRSYARSA